VQGVRVPSRRINERSPATCGTERRRSVFKPPGRLARSRLHGQRLRHAVGTVGVSAGRLGRPARLQSAQRQLTPWKWPGSMV